MNTSESIARILAITCHDEDPGSVFERFVFTRGDIDTIPPGWEAEVTYKLRKKRAEIPIVDIFEKMAVE